MYPYQRVKCRLAITAFCLALGGGVSHAATVYKYQDAQGHWHFDDKKPGNSTFEQVKTQTRKQRYGVEMHIERSPTKALIAENRLHAPVRLKVQFEDRAEPVNRLLRPRESAAVFTSAGDLRIPRYKYRYLVGDPAAQPDHTAYQTPFAALTSHDITQGFNGRFSHHSDNSRYAIDIALPIGTYIAAARRGVVVMTEEKFVLGGVSSKYFLDKANSVMILHDDGTFAVYGHLLPDSIMVKPGDHVNAGDYLARSGSSGYSSGPHLHFVVLVARNDELVSVPFELQDTAGERFTPQLRQQLHPIRRPPD